MTQPPRKWPRTVPPPRNPILRDAEEKRLSGGQTQPINLQPGTGFEQQTALGVGTGSGGGSGGGGSTTAAPTSGSYVTATDMGAQLPNSRELAAAYPLELDDNGGGSTIVVQTVGGPLAAPAGDRILFYDVSGSRVEHLEVGSGLTLSGTTLSNPNTGTVDGTGSANAVAYWTDSDTIDDSGWDVSGGALNVLNATGSGTEVDLNAALGRVRVKNGGGGNSAYEATLGGANPNFTIDGEGQMNWGDGSGAADVSLSRGGAGLLELNGGDAFDSRAYLQLDSGSSAPTPVAGKTQIYAGSGGDLFVQQESGLARGVSGLVSLTTSTSTVNNTAAETAFSQTFDFPADSLDAGSLVRIRFGGTYGITGNPNLTLRIKLDSVTHATFLFSAITAAGGFWGEVDILVRAAGASGTCESQGFGLATRQGVVTANNSATIAIDTTQIQTASITAQWSAMSVSNTVTLRMFNIEVIN